MFSEASTLPWAQQCLNQPYDGSLPGLLEQVAGLNAQTWLGPLVGIWTRMGPGQTAKLDALCAAYEIVKINLMRGTVHMVTARQYWAWRPALAPLLKRNVAAFCRGLWDRVDYTELHNWGTDFVSDGRPVTRSDLGEAAAQRFVDADSTELGFALRMILPLVEVPPRTVWQPVRTTYIYAPTVMPGGPVSAREGLQDLVQSFARAFGPASTKDFRYWSGLTMSETSTSDPAVVEGAPANLVPPPTTILPEFDNIYFCRRTCDAPLYAAKKDPRLPPARMPGTLVSDGIISAHWTASKKSGLRLTPWTDLNSAAIEMWDRFTAWYAARQ